MTIEYTGDFITREKAYNKASSMVAKRSTTTTLAICLVLALLSIAVELKASTRQMMAEEPNNNVIVHAISLLKEDARGIHADADVPIKRIAEKGDYENNNKNEMLLVGNKRSDVDNYFQMAQNGKFPVARKLPPIQVLQAYIRRHSQQQLQAEYADCAFGFQNNTNTMQHCPVLASRQFIVALYSCPEEAGNRLHSFMNALLLGMATNRTLLARYETTAVCLEYPRDTGRRSPITVCQKEYNNTQQQCEQVLQLAEWVPSFDEWHEKLQLPQAELVPSNQSDSYDSTLHNYSSKLVYGGFLKSAAFGLSLGRRKERAKRFSNARNNRRARILLSRGHLFLYGMLFESLFTIQPHLLPAAAFLLESSPTTTTTTTVRSYFVHSRHPFRYLKPQDVHTDRLCLQRLFNHTTNTSTTSSCRVYLMSDRPATVKILQDEVRAVGCVPVVPHTVANDTTMTTRDDDDDDDFNPHPVRAEHGPRAGAGYFRDLAWARQARHGFVAFHRNRRPTLRTSSSLVASLVQFRRSLETEVLVPLEQCTSY